MTRAPWAWALGAVAIGLVLAFAGATAPVSGFIRWLTLPVVRLFSSAGSRTLSSDDRVKELQAQLAAMVVDQVRLQSLEEENKTLRAQARFLDRSGYDSVGARVIGRDVSGQRALLTIDRGRNDSVEIGQAVITDDGIMVGKISSIQDSIAVVELLTDPNSRVAAAVQSKGQLAGVLEGRGNGTAVMTYIPSSEAVAADQVVVTAGTEDKVPGDLPLGIVNTVESHSSDPFFSATIEPLVNLEGVTFVSVLRPTALRPHL
ncbi:MAG TPA: rod shape-determining protein MreC [Verrucomicrobiae bacterium]|nr:rod shape-determining protein MreC [Verrucomicrobiae bacterium]